MKCRCDSRSDTTHDSHFFQNIRHDTWKYVLLYICGLSGLGAVLVHVLKLYILVIESCQFLFSTARLELDLFLNSDF